MVKPTFSLEHHYYYWLNHRVCRNITVFPWLNHYFAWLNTPLLANRCQSKGRRFSHRPVLNPQWSLESQAQSSAHHFASDSKHYLSRTDTCTIMHCISIFCCTCINVNYLKKLSVYNVYNYTCKHYLFNQYYTIPIIIKYVINCNYID